MLELDLQIHEAWPGIPVWNTTGPLCRPSEGIITNLLFDYDLLAIDVNRQGPFRAIVKLEHASNIPVPKPFEVRPKRVRIHLIFD